MEKKIDTLIVGATYFGIGYASVHPQECMIIEQSQTLGSDFHQNLRSADMGEADGYEAAAELGNLLRELHIWEDGKFDILKASPAIHKYVAETQKDIHILLDARLIALSREEEGYLVKYMDNEGIHFLRCGRVLDTTMCRDTDPAGARCTAKTLNLFTAGVTEGFEGKLTAVCPECRILEGYHKGEKIVKIPFEPQVKMLAAYDEMTKLWKKAFPDGEEKILFVAEEFESVCEEADGAESPCPWNGGRYANPLSAFAAGAEYQFS